MAKLKVSVLIPLVFLVGCDIEPRKYIDRCISSHLEYRIVTVPSPGHPGNITTRGQKVSVCEERETIRNPKHVKWEERQRRSKA